jgi:hypothetical protein
VELKVLVSTMSAPASSRPVDAAITSGRVRQSRSLLPLRSRPVGEALAAVVGLAEPVALDHGAHGAVEHSSSSFLSLRMRSVRARSSGGVTA